MSGSSSGSIEGAAMLLLEEALELPSGEREAFIRQRADIADDVRKLALVLLDTDRERPMELRTGAAGEALADDEDAEIVPPDLPGYRIIRLLGRGGMGAVFLAERSTRDFDHKVAIKVIKPGVLLDTLVERFRRERQILARLNHPNIAHLYDGGETADGQPYIVMEYVQGRTLRDWMSEDRPTLDQKLDLFLQAAHAVEFAHQNLIIHRDLTPGNVLVSESGQAKLIDFGIARPQVETGELLAGSPLSGLSLTPGFAAPERATGLAANTLTDVYSLGRILSLLTGRAGEPELDAIAERAAAAEPERRFASVSELIDEINNFRRKLPVTSFADTTTYRIRKFVLREKVLVAGVGSVLLAIVAGLVGTAWAYTRAEEARQEAEQRFTDLRELARFQLFDLYDQLDSVVGNTAARVALAERSQQYLMALAASHSGDAGLQLEAAEGFLKLALIQGVPAHPNFGEPELAKTNIERAEELLRPLSEQGDAQADTLLALAAAYRSLLGSQWDSDNDLARAKVAESEAALERVPASERNWNWMLARRVARMAALEVGDLELDSPTLIRYSDLLEADIAEWPRDRRGGYEEQFDRARVQFVDGIIEYNKGTPEGYRRSVQSYRAADRSFAAIEQRYPNDPMTLYLRAWNAYYGYASAATMDDYVQADAMLTQARDSIARLLLIEEADHSLNTFAERLLEAQAEYYSNTGRHDEAIAMMEGVVQGRRDKIGADRKPISVGDLAYGLAIAGTIYRKASRREEACRAWEESERLMAELDGQDALHGFVENLRPGMQANIRRCRAGEPVTAFQTLA